jgi:hypothetical protein
MRDGKYEPHGPEQPRLSAFQPSGMRYMLLAVPRYGRTEIRGSDDEALSPILGRGDRRYETS